MIKRLLEKEAIHLEEEIYEKYKPKWVRYVKMHSQYTSESALEGLLDSLHRAPKQRQGILTLFSLSATTKKPIKVSDLSKQSQTSTLTCKS